MNVSILSLRRHSDPGEIFSATVRIKVQLVANPVGSSFTCLRTWIPGKGGKTNWMNIWRETNILLQFLKIEFQAVMSLSLCLECKV